MRDAALFATHFARYLREPFSFGRRADSLIADFIADDRDLELRATVLAFERE
ncbi:MAG TPA: hypothetical protein VF266_10905 [Thermoanaerobaculia bacterium]